MTSRALTTLVCLLPVGAGAVLMVEGLRRRPRTRAELSGLVLTIDRLGWVAHDGHDLSQPMPPGMAPGLPARDRARLSVELTIHNTTAAPARFDPRELGLYREGGEPEENPRAPEAVLLPPGHLYSDVLEWDVPQARGELELLWRRGDGEVRFARVRPRPLPEGRQSPPETWPANVEALPRADARAGESLFRGRLGCVACHGAPERPGSETVGPRLAGLHTRAQHVYESLLDPNAQIAPLCPRKLPCPVPSTMPAYGELLSAQEMADLVAYLTFRAKE